MYEDKRVLSDPDKDDNNEQTLASLAATRGKFVTLADKEGAWGTVGVAVCDLP